MFCIFKETRSINYYFGIMKQNKMGKKHKNTIFPNMKKVEIKQSNRTNMVDLKNE
jgi:hypothetical protein